MAGRENTIIRNKIRQFSNLPTLSLVQSKLLKAIAEPGASVDDISDILHRDPTLSAKIVAVANSPFFGCPGRVESLEKAILMIGFDYLKGISLSICIFSFFPQTKSLRSMWAHSYAAASLAGTLSRRFADTDTGSAFLAGLLHDIGRLVFMKIYADEPQPNRTNEIFELRGRELLEAETETMFCTHADAGRWFLDSLTFPADVIEAVGMHHAQIEKIPPTGLAPVLFLVDGIMGLVSPELAGDGEWTEQHEIIFHRCGLHVEDKESLVLFVRDEEAATRSFFDI